MEPNFQSECDHDVIVVGGGIAGASLGAELAGRVRVLLTESEDQCGYHSTGRSAAFWLESYGGAKVARLSAASHDFLQSPPPQFARRGFLHPRGALHIATALPIEIPESVEARPVAREELETLVPGIREQWRFAIREPGCADIDVAALHAAYLAQFRRRGGQVRTGTALRSARFERGRWSAKLADGKTLTAAVLVNAAGAWADSVAESCGVAPIGIAPMRRTMVQLRVGRGGLRALPLIADSAGRFYFKGEGDRTVWLSPHDEIATDPCDAAADEIDVATAIARFETVVDWPVEVVERRWAGLRNFAPDRLPVYGFDPAAQGFFWCAGQGGFGIQTAPAAAKMAAAMLLSEIPDPMVADIDSRLFSIARLRSEREGLGMTVDPA